MNYMFRTRCRRAYGCVHRMPGVLKQFKMIHDNLYRFAATSIFLA